MIFAALALFLVEPTAMAGFYMSHQIEIGAALQLDDDGRFQYQLDYGAVSESAEGNWSYEGSVIYLTATRMEGANKTHNFSREPLKIEGDRLLLSRYDTVIRFERESQKRTAPSSPDFWLLPAPADKKSQELQYGDRGRTDDDQH